MLRRRFPDIAGPHKEDICYATTNRQNAVMEISPEVDVVLVVGSQNSSNSRRLVGYLGSFDATTWQKITWNLADWVARARGKFRNDLGAHAGFERWELASLLAERFSDVQLLTEEFLRYKYGDRLPRFALDLLLAPAIVDYSAPSNYAICRKRE